MKSNGWSQVKDRVEWNKKKQNKQDHSFKGWPSRRPVIYLPLSFFSSTIWFEIFFFSETCCVLVNIVAVSTHTHEQRILFFLLLLFFSFFLALVCRERASRSQGPSFWVLSDFHWIFWLFFLFSLSLSFLVHLKEESKAEVQRRRPKASSHRSPKGFFFLNIFHSFCVCVCVCAWSFSSIFFYWFLVRAPIDSFLFCRLKNIWPIVRNWVEIVIL